MIIPEWVLVVIVVLAMKGLWPKEQKNKEPYVEHYKTLSSLDERR